MAAISKTKEAESNPPAQEAQKTFAFIQITRLGDIIQTIQMAQHVRASHPELRLILIAREEFANPLRFLIDKYFDECFTLNLSKIAQNDLSTTRGNLREIIQKINTQAIDVSINLSYSRPSNFLHSLIHSTHKLGPFHNFEGANEIKDKWSQYLYSTVLRGSLNNFSLVDLFKNIVGVSPNLKLEVTKPEKTNKAKQNLIIHPFTSLDRKTWKIGKWTEIIYKALKDNKDLNITIVGAKTESALTHELMANPILSNFKNRIDDQVGRTTIEELHRLLEGSDLFIGHDSMVGHLASLTGTQTLTISLGSVRPIESTPYGENNYVLSPTTKCFPCFPDESCDYFQCHKDISYQVVSSSINQLLSGGVISEKRILEENSTFHLNATKILRTTFSKAGFLTLETILSDDKSTTDTFRDFYRIGWAYLLSEAVEQADFPKLSDKTSAELTHYMKGMQNLFELSEFGKKYSRYILEEISSQTPDINEIKKFSAKIDEIDQLQDMVSKTHPLLAPIIDYIKIGKSNLAGESIVELTESSFLVFNEASSLTSIIFELCESTLVENEKTKKLKRNIALNSPQDR